MTVAFPLQWPAGRPRTAQRRGAKFGKQGSNGKLPLTPTEAITRLADELEALRARNTVISSNLELRADGKPRGGQVEPIDPAVAVYFTLAGVEYCLSCDRWTRIADNIAAVAAHIEATRGIERWGVGSVREAFQGFAALPPPDGSGALHVSPGGQVAGNWRTVFGYQPGTVPTREELAAKFKELARRAHPDMPTGSADAMRALNNAHDEAKRALGFS